MSLECRCDESKHHLLRVACYQNCHLATLAFPCACARLEEMNQRSCFDTVLGGGSFSPSFFSKEDDGNRTRDLLVYAYHPTQHCILIKG